MKPATRLKSDECTTDETLQRIGDLDATAISHSGPFWHGSTRKPHQFRMGEDGGCFASALTSVRNYGGVAVEIEEGF